MEILDLNLTAKQWSVEVIFPLIDLLPNVSILPGTEKTYTFIQGHTLTGTHTDNFAVTYFFSLKQTQNMCTSTNKKYIEELKINIIKNNFWHGL